LRTGASALYFIVYEWIFSEREFHFIHIFFFLKSQVKKIVYETLEYYSQNIKTKKTLTRCETR